ncbi:MAG: hypothetical protein ACRECT_07350 [Thermoplasmata archaeon]
MAVVLVGLTLVGAFSGGTAGPAGIPGEALSYSEARSLADAAAANVPGGPWSAFSANGIDATLGGAFFFGISCLAFTPPESLHHLTGARPEVPAFTGALSSGLAPWWTFQYSNGTVDARNFTNLLVVAVVNGTATPILTMTCAGVSGVPPALPSGRVLDSPAILAAAVGSNASFFRAHPDLNASFGLTGADETPFGVVWMTSSTSCAPFVQSLFGPSFPGVSWTLIVNDTTGALPGLSFPENVACSSPG